MKKSGFTLIEVSIAISIFSILLIAIFGAYFNELKYSKYIEDTTSAQNSARLAMEAIISEIQNNLEKLDISNSTGNILAKLTFSPGDTPYLINFTGNSIGDIYLASIKDSSGNTSYILKYKDGSLLCDNIDIPQISLNKASRTINITLNFYISRRSGHLTMYNQAEKYMLTTAVNYNK